LNRCQDEVCPGEQAVEELTTGTYTAKEEMVEVQGIDHPDPEIHPMKHPHPPMTFWVEIRYPWEEFSATDRPSKAN
jgi:hypothetical protein